MQKVFSAYFFIYIIKKDITDLLTAIFPVIETRSNSNYKNLVNLLTNKTQYIVIVENVKVVMFL